MLKAGTYLWSVALVLLICLAPTALACGQGTHQNIMERAVPIIYDPLYGYLKAILSTEFDDANAGSVHPDAYYALSYLRPSQKDFYTHLAVVAHGYESTSYRDAITEYLRQREPMLDSSAARVLAFFMGHVCHQEADVAWHPQFLAMAEIEDDAGEGLIEYGVDVFCMWEQGERNDSVNWTVPVSAVREVFAACGESVKAADIAVGMALIAIVVEVERQVGPALLAKTINRLPWSHENYVNFGGGGLVDCAIQSAFGCEDLWDDMTISRARGAPTPRPSAPLTMESRALYQLAAELYRARAVSVPLRRFHNGDIELGRPRILDRRAWNRALYQRLQELLGR